MHLEIPSGQVRHITIRPCPYTVYVSPGCPADHLFPDFVTTALLLLTYDIQLDCQHALGPAATSGTRWGGARMVQCFLTKTTTMSCVDEYSVTSLSNMH